MSGFTVSSLTNYVIENENKILHASILSASTLQSGVTIQAGIKYSEHLNNIAITAPFQADGGCAFNASGSTTFNHRQLTVSKLKWQDTWCPEDLETKYTSKKLVAGSQAETEQLPFEQLIMDNVTKTIAAQMEQAIWQGDTTNHVFSSTLKQFNGWLQVIDAATPTYATATSGLTTGNIIGVFDNIYSLIPAAILNNPDKPVIAYCGWDTFRTLMIAIKNTNYYHYTTENAANTGEYTMPGSGMKVKAVHGLNNITGTTSTYKDRIVATYPQNLVFGTDLANDYEQAKVWYSPDDQNIKGSIKWKAGCQVYFPTELITYKNS